MMKKAIIRGFFASKFLVKQSRRIFARQSRRIFYLVINFVVNFVLGLFSPKSAFIARCEKMSALEIYTFLKKRESGKKLDRGKLPPHLHALFSYGDPLVREIIWEIKYRKNIILAEKIGFLLHKEILEIFQRKARRGKNACEDLQLFIVPVPISKKRRRDRGFNQCEIICEAIMKHASTRKIDDGKSGDESGCASELKYLPNLILKIKETRHQADLPRKERLKNVVGSFSISDHILPTEQLTGQLRGKNFIIIDDIVTTGGTTNEIRSVLLHDGARSAIGLAIAH